MFLNVAASLDPLTYCPCISTSSYFISAPRIPLGSAGSGTANSGRDSSNIPLHQERDHPSDINLEQLPEKRRTFPRCNRSYPGCRLSVLLSRRTASSEDNGSRGRESSLKILILRVTFLFINVSLLLLPDLRLS